MLVAPFRFNKDKAETLVSFKVRPDLSVEVADEQGLVARREGIRHHASGNPQSAQPSASLEQFFHFVDVQVIPLFGKSDVLNHLGTFDAMDVLCVSMIDFLERKSYAWKR